MPNLGLKSNYVDPNILNDFNSNIIHNPIMQISRRGNFSVAVSGVNDRIHHDRWKMQLGAVSGTYQENSSSQPSELPGSKSIKVTATSTATGDLGILQKIEEYYHFDGKQLTFSAYVKSNHLEARLLIYDGSSYVAVSNAHTGGGGWERLSGTFTYSSSGQLLAIVAIKGAPSGVLVPITSGDYIETTGVQLTNGSFLLPFQHRSRAIEERICDRYCLAFIDFFSPGYHIHNIAGVDPNIWSVNNVPGFLKLAANELFTASRLLLVNHFSALYRGPTVYAFDIASLTNGGTSLKLSFSYPHKAGLNNVSVISLYVNLTQVGFYEASPSGMTSGATGAAIGHVVFDADIL